MITWHVYGSMQHMSSALNGSFSLYRFSNVNEIHNGSEQFLISTQDCHIFCCVTTVL